MSKMIDVSGRSPNPLLEHPVEAALAGLLLLALLLGSSSEPPAQAQNGPDAVGSHAKTVSSKKI